MYKRQWITSLKITKGNAKKIVRAGRNRWKIENQGFNRQKHWQGNIEHACSFQEQAQKNHYLMERIADFIKPVSYTHLDVYKRQRVTYQKDHWVKGDLRPEHYFACTSTDADQKVTKYNQEYLKGDAAKQVIEYDVGFNQTIQVNSTADECFQHGIGRTVDDLVQAMQDVVDLENVKTKIEGLQETATGTDAETLTKQMEAVEKALTLAKDKCQKMFESGITTFQGYLDDANLCVTNCGTRSSKLELIDNRMKSQKTTFETLKSENEDIDVTETAIDLKSAEMTYEAALMATGKVMQTTLLNFI